MKFINNQRKTIILLSSKRSGSTLVQNIFRNNKNVNLCHEDQSCKVVECQFWSLSYELLIKKISYSDFKKKFKLQTFIDIKKIYLKQIKDKFDIFELWNIILDKYGPIIFDKSPQYLSNYKVIELILEYKKIYNNVYFIGIIRDPRDIITSQQLLWGGNITDREKELISKFNNLQRLSDLHDLAIIKYEDLIKSPDKKIFYLFQYCDLEVNQISKINFHDQSINIHENIFSKLTKREYPPKIIEIINKYNYKKEVKIQISKHLYLIYRIILIKLKRILKY